MLKNASTNLHWSVRIIFIFSSYLALLPIYYKKMELEELNLKISKLVFKFWEKRLAKFCFTEGERTVLRSSSGMCRVLRL